MCCRINDKYEMIHYLTLLLKYTDNNMSIVLYDIGELLLPQTSWK